MTIKEQARSAVSELIEVGGLTRGQVLVIGCSSSEIVGGTIGHDSNLDAAKEFFQGVYPVLKEKGIFLAAQCCEHLNRVLIVERECAEKYGWEPVCVVPQPKAGGSFATTAWENFSDPVAVEHIKAHAGMDVGGTFIGMHLRDVAVPVRLREKQIGNAILLAARTRPKYVGGCRAKYE